MILRSLLFLPANRLDRLDKALASGADRIALDLEDGVGPDAKGQARAALGALAGGRLNELAGRIAVRINSLDTPEGIRDMAAMLKWPVWPGMLMLPKVEHPAQISQIGALAASCGWAPSLMVTLETAAGIANAAAIARAVPHGGAIAYGSADHMAETGGGMTAPSLAHGRGQVVNAAAIARVPALDGVWLDYRDTPGLTAEAEQVKAMGFSGKIAIHPDQIAPINAVFSPGAKEIESARAMLDAANAAGGGAFAFNGKMVDAPVLARAQRIIDMSRSVK